MSTKNTKEEIPTDKRTKAFKTWKANHEKQSKGLGDTVEKITKATGIKKVVDKVTEITKTNCGCDEKQEKLNKLFPYQKLECLTEDEFNYLYDYFEKSINAITPDVQRRMVEIYNRVFGEKVQITACGSCFLNNVHKKLEKVLNEYL